MKMNKKNVIIIILSVLLIVSRFRPLIERGYCLNNNGDGIILCMDEIKPIHPNYNYIKYDNDLMGKTIYTFYLFNPFNNYTDDIIVRYDYVSRETLILNNEILNCSHEYFY